MTRVASQGRDALSLSDDATVAIPDCEKVFGEH